MNILLISGEVSGDLYASYLARQFKKNNSSHIIFGVGGDYLKKEVDTFVFESAYAHGIGLQSMFSKSNFKKALLSTIKTCLEKNHIQKIVIIDFQHYNFAIAKICKHYDVVIDTFVTPNFWMWKSHSNAKKVIGYSRYIYTIFKKEYDFYSTLTDNVFYFGHPLTDKSLIKNFHVNKQGLPIECKRITFLPGSRLQELKLYLDPMLQTICKLSKQDPSYVFKISLSATTYHDFIRKKLIFYQVPESVLVFEDAADLYAEADLVVAAAGTTTLEAILSDTLIIVLAALPPLTYLYAKICFGRFIKYAALPNFMCNQIIVPELIQSDISAKSIIEQIRLVNKNKQAILAKYHLVVKNISKDKNVFEQIYKKLCA